MELNNSFYQSIIAALIENHVEFILIGGLAVGYHRYSRYTGDMDLWIRPSNENMDNLYSTLLEVELSTRLN